MLVGLRKRATGSEIGDRITLFVVHDGDASGRTAEAHPSQLTRNAALP